MTLEQQLALEFCQVLRRWLTPEEMAEVVLRNHNSQYQGACATHDFCDANMAMLEAANNVGVDEEDYETWNRAWDIAKEADFALTE